MTDWTPDQLALLGDSRLRADARVLGLVISMQQKDDEGFGPPLPYDQASELLGKASKGAVQTAMHELTVNGWVDRKPGGRGHGDRFRFIGGPSAATYRNFRSALTDHLCDRWSLTDDLCALRVSLSDDLSVRRKREVEEGREVEETRAKFSTLVHPIVDTVLEEGADLFAGCRGALRDYLALRVPRDKQHGYVRVIEQWLNGTRPVMKRPDGTSVPPDDRADLIAATLNDLAASDEGDMARPQGDTGNARTKLRIMIDERYGTFSSARPPAPGGKPKIDLSDPSRYEGVS